MEDEQELETVKGTKRKTVGEIDEKEQHPDSGRGRTATTRRTDCTLAKGKKRKKTVVELEEPKQAKKKKKKKANKKRI